MKFTELFKQMEKRLSNYSGGFKTQVGLKAHPTFKNESELKIKTKELNEQIKERILLTCLLRTASTKENTLNILDNIIGDVLEENIDSLNDHQAAVPIFDKLSKIIDDLPKS